jgi:hypothetical protein
MESNLAESRIHLAEFLFFRHELSVVNCAAANFARGIVLRQIMHGELCRGELCAVNCAR